MSTHETGTSCNKSVAIKPGLYAIRHVDNWDGEGDICTSLARLDAKGHWTIDETGKNVLEYVGDEILQAWPLDDASAQVSFDSLKPAERVALLEVEQKDMPMKAWNVCGRFVFAARSARQAVEAHISCDEKFGTLRDNLDAGDAVELADFQLEMVESVSQTSFEALLALAPKASYLGKIK